MASIFYFSSRPNPLGFVSLSGHQGSVEKAAHFVEYAGLVTLLYRALASRQSPVKETGSSGPDDAPGLGVDRLPGRTALGLSFTIAFVSACLDELHQNLIPGRSGQFSDIGYDLTGIITALLTHLRVLLRP